MIIFAPDFFKTMGKRKSKRQKNKYPDLGVFMNIKTDYGFKRVFGNKELLMAFLNSLAILPDPISDITYLPQEQLGYTEEIRRAVYDLYVQTSTGQYFIIEMQISSQTHFAERMIFYASHAFIKQFPQGDDTYKIAGVYMIAILDSTIYKEKIAKDIVIEQIELIRTKVQLPFSDKYKFWTIELPKLNKDLSELSNRSDKILYSIENMENLSSCPEEMSDDVIVKKIFEEAKINKLTTEEMKAYRQSILNYSDVRHAVQKGKEDGREEGIEIGIKEGIEKGIKKGIEKGIEIGEKRLQTILIKRYRNRELSIEQITELLDITEGEVYNALDN
jgi:predicted transposase/invertase (TIGR01784 family)